MTSLFQRLEPKLIRLEERYVEIDARMGEPEIAQSGQQMAALMRERGQLEETVELFRRLRAVAKEIAATRQELATTSDSQLQAMGAELISELEAERPRLENELLSAYAKDEDETISGCILEVRAGTGGDEASLWAADLVRMYVRFAERQGWRTELLDESRSAVDGLKEAILGVSGQGCFAALRFESGGHRVQRIPTTETQGRIHTSAATVAVLPEVTEVELEIRDSDLRIDAFRSSGPGGQSVNKISSAIRITHMPSGVVVSCQDEKSQSKNKAKAMKILRSRIYDQEKRKRDEARSEARRTLIGSGDRSERIRTWNFPQSRVTDHRINLNLHNLPAVLEGNLDDLVLALRQYDREQRIRNLADEVG